jgi:hypothetical protein
VETIESSLGSPLIEMNERIKKYNQNVLIGKVGEFEIGPELPEDVKELAVIDPADLDSRLKSDGRERFVVIRQVRGDQRQNQGDYTGTFKIFFDDEIVDKWTNTLMDWESGADPLAQLRDLEFENSALAVAFVKKRGWRYIVHAPALKEWTDEDEIQYEDNFLPLIVASRVLMEGTSCDQWHRTASGASHYRRPLKYHGVGTAPQFGPNPDAPIAEYTESFYKRR